MVRELAYQAFLACIQLFRQRFSHKSVRAYAKMPTGIMGNKSLVCLVQVPDDSATRNEKERIHG